MLPNASLYRIISIWACLNSTFSILLIKTSMVREFFALLRSEMTNFYKIKIQCGKITVCTGLLSDKLKAEVGV